MKKLIHLTLFIALISFSACQKNALQKDGKVIFWYNSTGTNATVSINGQTGFVTLYYSGYDPNCGANGCANFTLPVGTYSWSAYSTFSNWSGTVTITNNGCQQVLLN